MRKQIAVFFDTEAWVEGPMRAEFDFKENMRGILDVLDRHDCKAVFNLCGILAEKYPKVVRDAHDRGHEIASHGYRHENFAYLEREGNLEITLDKIEKAIEGATGARPVGMRAPWYISNEMVNQTLKSRGYKWTSNTKLFRAELLDRPFGGNMGGLLSNKTAVRIFVGVTWNMYRKSPHITGTGLLDIPLMSSQDGELLWFVDPSQDSPKESVDFAIRTLKKQFESSGGFFNLNFHDWLVGTANRLTILDQILGHCKTKAGSEFFLPRDIAPRI